MSDETRNRPIVLLLEDEALIAVNLQDELQEAGYRVAGPFTTCAAALEWLHAGTPDTAILDTIVKDGPCREIARELSRREVPFLIYSGHREDQTLRAELQYIRWIEKPVEPFVLVQACQQLLDGQRQARPAKTSR